MALAHVERLGEPGKPAGVPAPRRSRDPGRKEQVEAARSTERARLAYLEGRTEFNLGHIERATELLGKVLKDDRLADLHAPTREMLEVMAKV